MTKIMVIQSLALFMYLSKTSNNPLKTSMMILMFSISSFLAVKIMMGCTWFPLIMLMLFAGGILMTFMILSSIMPNEKVSKMKSPKILMVWILFSLVTMMIYTPMKENVGETKSSIVSMNMYIFMMSMVMIYFLYSIGLNESEATPMRSICSPGSNFVIY